MPVWETTVTNAGSMPGYSSVRVEVEGMTNLPVRIWQGEEEGLLARTGSSAPAVANVAEFRNLALGRHMIEPEGLGRVGGGRDDRAGGDLGYFPAQGRPLGANEVRAEASAAHGAGWPASSG